MPLSKKRNKERMRAARSVQPACNLARNNPVQPKPNNPVQPKQAKLAELRELISGVKVQPGPAPEVIPCYNPRVHRPGDRVLFKGHEVIVPEVDAEGNIIP